MDERKILLMQRKKRIEKSSSILFCEVSRHCKNSKYVESLKNHIRCRDIVK